MRAFACLARPKAEGGFGCRFLGAEGGGVSFVFSARKNNGAETEVRTFPLPTGKGGHLPRRAVREVMSLHRARGSVGEVCGMQAARWEWAERPALCAGGGGGPPQRATFSGAVRFRGQRGERRRGALSR